MPSNVLQFDTLSHITGLQYAITLRTSGISKGPYDSLNLGYHVGDEAADVTRNRKRLAASLGYDAAALVCAQQVHGAGSEIVGKELSGQGALDWQSALPETDALMVQEPQVPVLILVADCAPLLLVDARQHVLAVVHAGWRGAVAGIASKTIVRMQADLQSDPATIHAGIGPCLCRDCFEIGSEVAEAAGAACPKAVIAPLYHNQNTKSHLNLRTLLMQDLISAGVQPEHIETLSHCPRCLPQMFFSHRGQGGTAGRFGLVAWWDS